MNRSLLLLSDKSFFFWGLVVAIMAIGLLVPKLYDWSGADQSRPSPEAELTFHVAAGFVVAAILALPWLPIKTGVDASDAIDPDSPAKPFQFNVLTLLLLISAIAVLIAGMINSRLVTVVLLIATSLAFCMWMVAHRLSVKWQMLSLLSCMYLPWIWVLFDDDFDSLKSEFAFVFIGIPSFAPSMILSRMVFDQRLEHSAWLLFVLTAAEFGIGLALIWLGPKRAVAWQMLVLLCSLIGSFGLNALMRI